MKLEAVDKSNASLVCVATVANVMDGRILVHFDGWEADYDYWVIPHISPYIHPVGWCQQHGLELNPPKSKYKVTVMNENLLFTITSDLN
jgi:lethal(3)malignant brain tumor-like protein